MQVNRINHVSFQSKMRMGKVTLERTGFNIKGVVGDYLSGTAVINGKPCQVCASVKSGVSKKGAIAELNRVIADYANGGTKDITAEVLSGRY